MIKISRDELIQFNQTLRTSAKSPDSWHNLKIKMCIPRLDLVQFAE